MTPPAAGAGPKTVDPPEWKRRFVEQVGSHDDVGLPRSLARVLAWLIVCEPRHQSVEQLRGALELSSGSVSAATTALVRAGIVARRSFPGDRRTYYELRPDGWQRLLASRLRLLAEVRQVAEEAIASAAGGENERLRAMRDFYAACEAQFAKLLDGPAAPSRKRQAKPRIISTASKGPAKARRSRS